MSKELSRHGDTTTNTYIDPGAETKEAYEISKKSRTLARTMVGNANEEDRVRQRCSIAVGDFGMAELMRFQRDPVAAALAALERHALIITDIRMVQVGIQKKGHASEILCALDFGAGDRSGTGNYPEFGRLSCPQGKTCRVDRRGWQRTVSAPVPVRNDQSGNSPGCYHRSPGRICQRSGVKGTAPHE